MKHRDALERWYLASGQASDNARSLAFAGIAVVWVLSGGGDNPTAVSIEDALILPLLAFVTTLFLDFLQYALQSLLWRIFSRRTETRLRREHNGDPAWREAEIEGRVARNVPGEACFWGKQVALGVGYVFLGAELMNRLL